MMRGKIIDVSERTKESYVMPAKKDRCVSKVQKQGHKKSNAFAICTASMKKGGKKK